MNDQQMMRASDHDRQRVVDRLRSAVEDGRLKLDEYVVRMDLPTRRRPMAILPRSTPICLQRAR
jgi:hypothetical protein